MQSDAAIGWSLTVAHLSGLPIGSIVKRQCKKNGMEWRNGLAFIHEPHLTIHLFTLHRGCHAHFQVGQTSEIALSVCVKKFNHFLSYLYIQSYSMIQFSLNESKSFFCMAWHPLKVHLAILFQF